MPLDEDVLASLVCVKEMERQVEEQSAKRRDLETTLKLLEKDAWAKQATVAALRKQLEDIKTINQDISNKIRVPNVLFKDFFRSNACMVASGTHAEETCRLLSLAG